MTMNKLIASRTTATLPFIIASPNIMMLDAMSVVIGSEIAIYQPKGIRSAPAGISKKYFITLRYFKTNVS